MIKPKGKSKPENKENELSDDEKRMLDLLAEIISKNIIRKVDDTIKSENNKE